MKHARFLLIIICSLLIASVAFAETPKYVWKFAHEEAPDIYEDAYAKEFAARLAKKSNGQIKVDVFPLGTLGGDLDIFEACIGGAIEFVISSPGVAATVIPEAQFFNLHFLFDENMAVNQKVLSNKESKALGMLNQTYARKGIKVLSYWTEGWMSWTSNKLIEKVGDFKGVKFRTMRSPLIIESYRAYEANPTPVPFAEVYSGLQLGMIEGQENPDYYIYANKLMEVQKYLIRARHSLFVTATVTNEKFFNSLPQDIQAMIVETVDEMQDYIFKWQEEFNAQAVDKMVAANPAFKVIDITPEARQKFQKMSMPVRQKYVELLGTKEAAELIDAIIKEIEGAK